MPPLDTSVTIVRATSSAVGELEARARGLGVMTGGGPYPEPVRCRGR